MTVLHPNRATSSELLRALRLRSRGVTSPYYESIIDGTALAPKGRN